MSLLWKVAVEQHPFGPGVPRRERVPTADLVAAASPGVDERQVKDYAEAMKDGWRGSADEPVELHRWERGAPFLNDGSHRAHAADRAGLTHLEAEVYDHGPGSSRPDWLRSY